MSYIDIKIRFQKNGKKYCFNGKISFTSKTSDIFYPIGGSKWNDDNKLFLDLVPLQKELWNIENIEHNEVVIAMDCIELLINFNVKNVKLEDIEYIVRARQLGTRFSFINILRILHYLSDVTFEHLLQIICLRVKEECQCSYYSNYSENNFCKIFCFTNFYNLLYKGEEPIEKEKIDLECFITFARAVDLQNEFLFKYIRYNYMSQHFNDEVLINILVILEDLDTIDDFQSLFKKYCLKDYLHGILSGEEIKVDLKGIFKYCSIHEIENIIKEINEECGNNYSINNLI